jgi:histidine triad (HIT) family protein
VNRADCVFCEIVADWPNRDMIRVWPDALAFIPLNPVTRGHLLVIPRAHVPDLTTDYVVSGSVMQRAAELADSCYPCNVITSAGPEATQTIRHLHLHVVPRREDDGLRLPWTSS